MSNNEQETALKPMASFHDEICKFARGKLRPTETKISYADGRQFVKSSSSDEEREIVDQNDTKLLVMNDDQTSSTYWTRFSGYVVQVNADLSIDEILPNFYLSGDDVALNRELLKTRNVSHIVNLTTNVPNKFESDNIIYQRIVIYDLPTESIAQHFKDTYGFIDAALSSGKSVLVHCNAGVSRSSTIVIGYLLQKGIYKTFKEAYDHVKAARPKIFPNPGFIKQLKDLEKNLYGAETADDK